jgi:hypothetical protein
MLPSVESRSRRRLSRAGTKRPLWSCGRPLRIEQLERRCVLSGLADSPALAPDQPDQQTDRTPLPAPLAAIAVEADSHLAPNAAEPRVVQTPDGVVHVHAAAEQSAVVVREFVNFRLERVVEIELAGRWTQFSAGSVRGVQVHSSVDGSLNHEVPVSLAGRSTIGPDSSIEPQLMGPTLDSPAGDPLPQPPDATWPAAPGTLEDATPSSPSPGEGEGMPGGSGTPLMPPVIMDFCFQMEFNQWLFSGRVLDDKPVAGLVVRFGGILSGRTAVVAADGIFEIFVELPPYPHGIVSARVTDRDNLEAEPAILHLIT